jgi:hypothetical protein
MTTLASLSVKIVADASSFYGELDRAASRTQSFQTAVIKNLQTAGKIGMVGLGLITTAAGAAGAALTKLAVDAAQVEGAQMAFEGLAQSAGQSADELLDALEKGSSGMIAQRDLMKSYNLAAQLVSTDFAQTLPDAMQYLSKVAASTGQDMDYLLSSYVRGIGRLSPLILDNMAVQIDLTETYDAYAAKVDKATDALTKQEKQMALAEATLAKLAENTAALPDLTETAAAKMAQLKAMLRNMRDEAGMALLPVLSDMLSTLGKIGEKALPLLVNLLIWRVVPILEKGAAFVGSFVDEILAGRRPIDALTRSLRDIGLDKVATWLTRVRGAVGDLWDRVRPFVVQVLEWVGAHIKLRDVLAAFGVAISSVVIPAIWGVIAAAAPVAAVFMGLVGLFALVRTAWTEDWGGIRSFIQRAIRGIWRFISRLITMVKSGELKELFSSLDGRIILDKIGEGLKAGAGVVKTWVADHIVTPIATFITETDWSEVGQTILTKIGEGLATAYDVVRTWVTDHIVTPISTFIAETDWSAVGQAIQTKIGETFETVKGFASEKFGELLDLLSGNGGKSAGEAAPTEGGILGVLNGISTFISGPGGTALSVIGTIIGLITGIGAPIAIIIGLIKLLSWAWENNFGGIREFTAGLVFDLETWFGNIKTWASDTFENVKTNFTMALLALEPFIEGAKQAWQWITGVAIPTIRLWGYAFARGLQPHLERISEKLKEFWETIGPKVGETWNALKRALERVWKAISEKLWPAIQHLLDALGIDVSGEDFFKGLGDIVGFLLEWGLDALIFDITTAIDGLILVIDGGAIILETFIGFLSSMIEFGADLAGVFWDIYDASGAVIEKIKLWAQAFAAITGIELPDWLKPGSPPPLYYALMDIADAMDVISSRRLPDLDMGLSGDTMGSMRRAVGSGPGGAQGNTSVVLYGPVHVEGVQDGKGLIEQLQALAG